MHPSSDMRAGLFVLIAVCAYFSAQSDAAAFCRTTTCKCTKDQSLPPAANGLPQSTCGLPDGDCPRDEHGCVTRGTPVAWSGGCVGYSPNLIGTAQLTDEEWKEAFRQSFHAWQLVDCGGGKHPSIQLFELRATSCAESAHSSSGPNVNSVYFTDSGWSGPQTKENIDDVLARTKINFALSGEILDADLAINSGRKEFSVTDAPATIKEDLVSVLTHEVGHFLGVAHSDVPEAVMYWQYAAGTTRRKLHQDDIDAICTIYPPDRIAACEPTPKGGLQDTCGVESKLASPGCTMGRGDTAPAPSGATMSALGVVGFFVMKRLFDRVRTRRIVR